MSKIIGGGTRICDAAAEYALVQSPELGSGGPDETVDVSDVKGTCKG